MNCIFISSWQYFIYLFQFIDFDFFALNISKVIFHFVESQDFFDNLNLNF